MLKKALLLLFVLQCAAMAAAQKSLSVQLPANGDYVVSGSHGLPGEAPQKPTTSTGGTVSVPLALDDDQVTVWDRKTGNVATIPVAKVQGSWAPKPEEFSSIALVDIVVEHNDVPVAAGQVELDDGQKRPAQIIDSKSQGTASFFAVKPGRLIVTVRFRKGSGASDSITQVFQSPLQRSEIQPKFKVALADAVDTVTATPNSPVTDQGGASVPTPSLPSAGGNMGATKATANQPANPLGSIIVFIAAIAIVAALVYGFMWYAKNNSKLVSEKLEQLGVQIPKPGGQGVTSADPIQMEATPKPMPPQKIILDDAAPDPIPVAAPSMALSQPSLVSDSGVAIPLSDGETVVGREAGLGLSLTAETSVSRRHASLTRTGNEVTLTDLGSTNGTFVNSARLQSLVVLRPGDSVQFGSIRFRYEA